MFVGLYVHTLAVFSCVSIVKMRIHQLDLCNFAESEKCTNMVTLHTFQQLPLVPVIRPVYSLPKMIPKTQICLRRRIFLFDFF